MAESHGKLTFVSLAAQDLSAFTDSTTKNRGADEHDTTCYGSDDHTFVGGLLTGNVTIGGKYVTGATGPATLIEPLIGTVVTFIYQAEGTGSSLPQQSMSVHVKAYNQSAPVADIIRWTAELTVSGPVDATAQAA